MPVRPPRRLAAIGRWGTADIVDPRALQALLSLLMLLEWLGWSLSDPTRLQWLALILVVGALLVALVVPWQRLGADVDVWGVAWLGAMDVVAIGVMQVAVPAGVSIVLLGMPGLWLGRVGLRGIQLCAVAGVAGITVPALLRGGPAFAVAIQATVPVVVVLAVAVSKRAALARDAHERRVATALIETVGVGLQLVDPDGTTVRQNGSVPRVTSPDGPGSIGLAGSDTALRADQQPAARAAAGERLDGVLVWVEPEPGAPRSFYSVFARPVLDERGEVAAAAIAWQDVTPLVLALDGERDFLAAASHELRSPMTAITGYLELLDDEDQVDEQVVIAKIKNSSERILSLLNDLLLQAETQRGDLRIQLVPVDLVALAREATAAVAARAAQAGIEVELDVTGEVDCYADPARVAQVLDNLVSNAVKYGRPGGHVWVVVAEQADVAVVTVRDDGIGIAEEDVPLLFDRWFRADAVRRSSVSGTGLGLSIARQIIELHGGSLAVTSALGQGSAFTVRLPRRSGES